MAPIVVFVLAIAAVVVWALIAARYNPLYCACGYGPIGNARITSTRSPGVDLLVGVRGTRVTYQSDVANGAITKPPFTLFDLR
jgi:hypothetical protein